MEREPSHAWFFFSPFGRLSRRPYGLGLLFWFCILAAFVAQLFAADRVDADGRFIVTLLLLVLIAIFSVISLLMLTIKRVHDIGHSGLYAFVILVPAISLVAMIFFLVFPSGPSKIFGSRPNWPDDRQNP